MKKKLTIHEQLELDWDDGKFNIRDEKFFRNDFEIGLKNLKSDIRKKGHHKLKFDPKKLITC